MIHPNSALFKLLGDFPLPKSAFLAWGYIELSIKHTLGYVKMWIKIEDAFVPQYLL